MPNPTSGFQLSALPQPLSFPTNIGNVDVGQMQKAYSNALQNVQDTTLFGQRVAAQRAALDYQEQLAKQQQSLLAPQAAAQRATYGATEATQNLTGIQAGAQIPQAADIARLAQEVQKLKTQLEQKQALGALPYAEAGSAAKSAGDLQQSLIALGQGQFASDLFGAPTVSTPVIQQPSAPKQSTTALPTVNVTQPAQLTPAGSALSTFGGTPQTALGAGPATEQQAAAPSPTPAAQEAEPTAPVQQQLPANVKQLPNGDYNVSGITIPARSYNTPQIQELIGKGFEPQSRFKWLKIDKDNMREQEATITSRGVEYDKAVPLNKARVDQIDKARAAIQLASTIDPSYQPQAGASEPSAITHAANVYAKREVTNQNQLFPATNPGSGIADPVKNAEAQKKARDEASAQIDNENNFKSDINNVRSSLNEFRELNSRLPTGPLTASVLTKYLTVGGNIEDFVKKLTGSEATFVKENSDILQRMKVIHDTTIPGLIRSLNGKVGAAGAQTGGAAGIGRIMFNEVPWLAGSSPSIFMGQNVNAALIERNLAQMDRLLDKIDYRQQFFEDYGHLKGSLRNFDKYERQNPYFDPKTGAINNNRIPWTQGLMSEQWREDNGDVAVPKYQNVMYPQAGGATGTDDIDITQAPPGLSREGIKKWAEQQRAAKKKS